MVGQKPLYQGTSGRLKVIMQFVTFEYECKWATKPFVSWKEINVRVANGFLLGWTTKLGMKQTASYIAFWYHLLAWKSILYVGNYFSLVWLLLGCMSNSSTATFDMFSIEKHLRAYYLLIIEQVFTLAFSKWKEN